MNPFYDADEHELHRAKLAIAKSKAHSDLLLPGLHDSGNAERLVHLFGHQLRYCHSFRKWLRFDGRRWKADETDQARKFAKQTIVEFLGQAVQSKNDAAEKFARQSLDAKRITNMLSMAEFEIFVTPDQLDQDIWALNFLNGTVDLRTGERRDHNPSDFITKLIHHHYRPDAECPVFLASLARMMGAGPEAAKEELERADRLVAYIQKALGYSLTGSTLEKVVFILYEPTNAGKTTILEIFRWMFEEYAALLSIDTLMVKQENSNSQADLADLRGARFVQTSETEEGQRLSEGRLKRITQGMGKIKSCRKYENPIEFSETHKLWIDGNYKPVIRGTDNSIWNRLRLIPFTVTISENKIDRDLPRKLRAEVEGIVAWYVRGAVCWHREGLGHVPEIDLAVRAYQEEMDQTGRFIAETCVVKSGVTARAHQLYSAYRAWADRVGEHPVAENLFGKRLGDRGLEKVHLDTGNIYTGIGLKING